VLAILLLHVNRVVSTDFLVDGLWGEQPSVSAVNVVQAYISRLRALLTHLWVPGGLPTGDGPGLPGRPAGVGPLVR
jgi:DNA-binding response OmpR family regulator